MQTAVCFDSSFAHFRVHPKEISEKYNKRRDRFLEMMQTSFFDAGFYRVMYLFKQYNHADAHDFDDLLKKSVAPWHVSDESCGPAPDPVVPFSLIFVALLSRPEHAAERAALREEGSWLRGLSAALEHAATTLFFVRGGEGYYHFKKL